MNIRGAIRRRVSDPITIARLRKAIPAQEADRRADDGRYRGRQHEPARSAEGAARYAAQGASGVASSCLPDGTHGVDVAGEEEEERHPWRSLKGQAEEG